MLRTFKVTLTGKSPLFCGAYIAEPLKDRESHDDHEKRTWRDRANADTNGNMFIPAMGIKRCIEGAVNRAGDKIKGKGQRTWSKVFMSGMIVPANGPLIEAATNKPFNKNTVAGTWVFVPSDGMRGGSKRVNKCFPTVLGWKSTFDLCVTDDAIPEDLLKKYIGDAGMFVGFGCNRIEKGGTGGFFVLESCKEVK